MSLINVLILILILSAVGLLPAWNFHRLSYTPSVGIIVILILVLVLTGRR